MADCLFCRIAAGEIKAKIIHQDDQVIAFEDISPQAPVHILVIPRRHVASLNDLGAGEDDAALAGRMIEVINRLAKEKGVSGTGYRVVTNVGKDAQQSVLHLHWHLIGGRPFGWPPG